MYFRRNTTKQLFDQIRLNSVTDTKLNAISYRNLIPTTKQLDVISITLNAFLNLIQQKCVLFLYFPFGTVAKLVSVWK